MRLRPRPQPDWAQTTVRAEHRAAHAFALGRFSCQSGFLAQRKISATKENWPELAGACQGADSAAQASRARGFAAQAPVLHPVVEDALLKLPAIAEFEGRDQVLGNILVKRIGRNTQIL